MGFLAFRRRCLASFLCLVVLAASARAEPAERPDVQRLLNQASRQYAEKDYAGAAATLEKLYALHPAPRVLFNMARAYERAGDSRRAERAYEQYLRVPGGEAELTQRARDALTLLRASAVPPEASDRPSTPPSGARSMQTPPPAAPPFSSGATGGPAVPPRTAHVASTLLFASSGLSLALGAALGIWANHTASLEKSSVDPVDKPSLRSQAYGRAIAADVAFGLGAALAVTGLVVRFTLEKTRNPPTVSVGLGAGGVTLTWSAH